MRLRVGDIEIDGSHVRVGTGVSNAASHGVAPRIADPPGAHTDPRQALLRIPSRWLAFAGAAVAAVGMARLATTAGPLDLAHFVSRGAFLLPLGAGIVALGGLTAIARRWPALLGADGAADRPTRRGLADLRDVLRAPGLHTVSTLAGAAAWPEADVVRALGWLRSTGELDEEFDLDSGQLHYTLIERPRDLATRLSHLHHDVRP